MGLPALQHFAHLTSAVETRSNDVVHVGEVISMAAGSIVRDVNDALRSQRDITSLMAEGCSLVAQATHEELSGISIQEIAKLRLLFKRFVHVISRPMLERPTGWSLVGLPERLEAAKLPRLGDRRLWLRQAHKLRASADLCERQRVRLHAQIVDLIKRLDKIAQNGENAAAHEQAYMAELMTSTRDRHPVINAYLAR